MSTGVDIISLILAITIETVSRMSTEVDLVPISVDTVSEISIKTDQINSIR